MALFDHTYVLLVMFEVADLKAIGNDIVVASNLEQLLLLQFSRECLAAKDLLFRSFANCDFEDIQDGGYAHHFFVHGLTFSLEFS